MAFVCLNNGRCRGLRTWLGKSYEMKKKPDALVILAVVFGLGVLVSSLTYGGNEARLDQMAASAGVKTLNVQR